MGKKRKILSLELINFDEEYQNDMDSGRGFIIDNTKSLTNEGKRTLNGIYSPLYGSDLSTDTSEVTYDWYQCSCGNLIGKFYKDMECPVCHTKVEKKVDDIFKTGWIIFKHHHIINPQLYIFLSRLIGPKALNDILDFNREIDRNGNLMKAEGTVKNPYMNIGLEEFYEKFDEILEFFKNKAKPEKIKFYDFIKKHREKVFINKFPVFSLILRPILIIKNEVLYSDINKKFQMLVTCSNSLNEEELELDKKPLKTMPFLYQAQTLVNEIYQNIITSLLAEKKGLIRSSQLGCRLNFSSRNVIVPLIEDAEINKVKMPYLTFMELFKFELINLIRTLDKISLAEANKKWNEALFRFDKRIYLLMDHLVKNTKGGLKIILNRNPTLNLGSILIMTIQEVKKDITDVTLDIPVYILGLLAGDFDGDVLNIISLKDKEVIDALEPIFNPVQMVIDRNNGKYNRSVGILKDQVIGLYSFCNR